MKILILGINYSPEAVGTGRYTGDMARWLARAGDHVRVVTAVPYYPQWRVFEGFSRRWYSLSLDETVHVTRCPLYVPRSPGLVRRLLHLGSFAMLATGPMLGALMWRPDVIVAVAPTIFCAPLAWFVALFSGAVPVLHVQDFEIDAMVGAGIGREGLAARFARSCESFVLRRFSVVSTISDGMVRRAQAKGVDPRRVVLLPNWADIENIARARPDPTLLTRLGMRLDRPIILYSGNIGQKQGLVTVLDAARDQRLQACQFLICGEGAGREQLVALKEAAGLSNVVFQDVQPPEQFASLLVSADCHLVVQKAGVADAVLPSKLTNILAAGGNAVVTAGLETSLGAVCEQHPGTAIRVSPDSAPALADGICAALAMPRPNHVAIKFAGEYLAIDAIMGRYRNRLIGLRTGTAGLKT